MPPATSANSRYGHSLYALSPDGNPRSPRASVPAQCAALQQLDHVSLLVGRGIGEETRWWTQPIAKESAAAPNDAAEEDKLEDEKNRDDSSLLFIPTDIFGGAFSTAAPNDDDDDDDDGSAPPPPPHLWLSFTNIDDLQHITTSSISRIVFDFSTWRYMKLAPPVLREWARILVPDGWLAFDAGLASVRLDSSAAAGTVSWDCDNPTHAVVADKSTWDAVVALLGRKSKSSLTRPSPAVTMVLPAPTIAPALPHPLMESLVASYTALFVSAGFDTPVLVQDADYPVRTRGYMRPWFKIAKTGVEEKKKTI
ncbi:hypothetical protein HDU87_001969 [Geranomyces variabilis]|uniref:Uncharacterized protein n=1 Tax=Geranomyces variabilis TaxID=109894 RepID=A0AAD5XTJ9_9FUNG|nr:hypothetical protein HDU87_001969 [Geranomyces variabilis]